MNPVDESVRIEEHRVVRFWRWSNMIGLISCLVALPADLTYAQKNHNGIIIARILGYVFFVGSIFLRGRLVVRYIQQLFLALVVMVATTMGYITIYTKGPETLYFMGIVQAMLAVLLIGKVTAKYAGASCLLSFLIYASFLIYGGFFGRTFVPSDSFSSVLLSLAIFLVLAYFLNSIIINYRLDRDREYAEKNHILANVEDAIFSLTAELRFVQLNKAGSDMLQRIGAPVGELRGKLLKEIFPELADSPLFGAIEETIAGKTPRTLESYFPIMDRHYTVRIVPFDSGAILYFHDISDQIQKEKLAKQATEDAERRDRFKTKLITVINHELGSPIFSMIADAEVIAIRETDPKIREIAVGMVSTGKSLQRLTKGLLDYSTAELGKSPPNTSATANLGEALRDVRRILNEKDLLSDELIEAVGAFNLRCEQIRIFQTLVNLLGNAKKYSLDGKIILDFEIKPLSIVFQIKNKSSVRPEEIRFHFLDRSAAAADDGKKQMPGYGVGLYIIKGIMDSMGGYIWVTRENELIVFNIEFPLATTGHSPTAPNAALPEMSAIPANL